MGTPVSVQVFVGGQPTGTHQFNSDTHRTVKIGRLSSAQLKLNDPKAAKIHAVIDFSSGKVSLIDMGSSAGTLVNGSKVHKIALNTGDQVIIGDTQLLIGVGNGAATASPAMAGTSVATSMQGHPSPTAGMPGMSAQPAVSAAGVHGSSAGLAPQMGQTMVNRAQSVVPQAAPGNGAMGGQGPTVGSPAGNSLPRFDGNQQAPVQRITQARLRSAAVESRPHPSLPPEETVGPDSRALEMRVYWGQILLSINHYTEPKAITIGEVKGTNFFISSEGLPVEAFPLVRFVDDEYVLTFSAGMDGEVEIGGQLQTLRELKSTSLAKQDPDLTGSYSISLPVDARALIHWGGATFAFRFVAPPQPLASQFFQSLDLQYLNMLLLSIFFHLVAVTTFVVYPYDTDALREDLFQEGGRFVELMVKPPDEKKSRDLLKQLNEKIEQKKPKPKERKVKPELKVTRNRTNEQVRTPRSQAQKQAQVNQQFSKLFSGGGGGGSLLGGAGGGSLSGSMMNVIGTTGSGGKGALAGLGIRGGVMTGGGIGTSRGVAGIGTSGRLGGGGLNYGSRVGKLGRGKERAMISLATPVVMGSLPKEVIKKVINQNRNQIRFCYEFELQRNQQLTGKIQMKWVIGATGSVVKSTVTQDTMQTKQVGLCLRKKILGWKFPAPAGGGIVEVNYPFVFKSN